MSLVVGWLDNGTTAGSFTESVTMLCAYEAAQQRLATTIRVLTGPQMSEGRNELVSRFLSTPAEWLLMIDSDMAFSHDAAEKLLKVASAETTPVVGALCFGINKEFGQFPTVYYFREGIPTVFFDIPDSGLLEVDGTGSAFILQHRSVFEDNQRPGPHPWYHRLEVQPVGDYPGGVLGEDLSWCWHLRENQVPIVVNFDVQVGHVKQTMVNKQVYDMLREQNKPKLAIVKGLDGSIPA